MDSNNVSIASYASGFGTVLLSHVNEIAAIVGCVVAVATYFTNLYFKRRMLDLAMRQGVGHGPKDGGH